MNQQDDDHDFSSAMGNIEPLRKSGRQLAPKPTLKDAQSLALRRAAATAIAPTVAALGEDGFIMLESEQSLSYHRAGLDAASLRRLQHGHMRPSLYADLHGYRVEEARDLVWRAIKQAQAEGDRCLLIIHGKAGAGYTDESGDIRGAGQALLKSHVNHWLQQVDDVLAFASALPKDGGTGAVYVLLKNSRKKQSK
jgi:DNA-nicking Smr family endonuclease